MKILLVEDNKYTIEYLSDLLEEENYYTIEIADTGKKALKMLNNTDFNLILLDHNLPDIKGLEILKKIRNKYNQSELPVILLSSITDNNKIAELLKNGANDFISKPFEEINLKIKINNLLELQRLNAEQKQLQNKLLEAQQISNLGYAEWDLKTGFVELSNEAMQIFKLNDKIVKLRTLIALIHPADRYFIVKKIREALKGDTYQNIEHRMLLKNNKCIYVKASAKLYKNADKKVYRVLGTLIDVTELKAKQDIIEKQNEELVELNSKYEEQLEEFKQLNEKLNHINIKLAKSEEKFRNLVKYQGEGVGIVNLNEEFIFANPAAEKIFGVKNGLTGRNLKEFTTDEQWEIIKMQSAKRSNLQNSNYELDIVQKNGKKIHLIVTATPQTKNGEHISTLAIFRDITELKEKEIQLQKAIKTKDKFMNIIAHDLRTPFHAILGFSQILKKRHKEYDEEKRERIINFIYESGQSSFTLLENLLEWSRTQTGKTVFNPDYHLLENLFSEAIFQTAAAAKKKNISLSYQLEKKIIIHADKFMIDTILRNLISNAIKFTHKNGKIKLSVKEDNKNIIVYVSDTGIGINKEIKNKLFDISQKTTSLGTENENGTGIGLLLCKEFIEKHNGKIWVESEEGKGSTFYFSIPDNQM